jgi:CheY-like chemotaxis protein
MKDTMPDTGTAVVAAVGDLIFGARIRGAAEQAGVPVHFSRTLEDLRAVSGDARMVLIDLDARWLDGPRAIAALRSAEGGGPESIIAFVSHVRADAIAAARAAGADRVLARSAFVKELPALLAGARRSDAS